MVMPAACLIFVQGGFGGAGGAIVSLPGLLGNGQVARSAAIRGTIPNTGRPDLEGMSTFVISDISVTSKFS